MLPDDVILVIFDFYGVKGTRISEYLIDPRDAWRTLAHVCRRWRSVVFGSPRRLNLQLVCTTKTPVRDTLDVWPALPLVIQDLDCKKEGVDNIIALLEHSELVGRISQIYLGGVCLEGISRAMEISFPELTDLALHHNDETKPAIPLSDLFLGGSTPRLQYLDFDNISFPGLPKLLLSATVLTELHIEHIPRSGYISPEAIVACLSVSNSLGVLSLEFQSPQSHPDQGSRRPPSQKRTVLPVLSRFWFKGVGEYLEDLVARVDAPRLNFLHITFFNDIVFETPQFNQFISHTPTLKALDKASIALGDDHASIKFSSKTSGGRELNVSTSCRELDWQVSFLEQVCTSTLPPLSTLEDLYIYEHTWLHDWEENLDNSIWLELLYLFTTAKNLYLSEKIASHIVPALQELLGGRTTEVLPTLQNIYVEELQPSGPVQEGVGKFIAARQVTSHPITVSRWDRDPSRTGL